MLTVPTVTIDTALVTRPELTLRVKEVKSSSSNQLKIGHVGYGHAG